MFNRQFTCVCVIATLGLGVIAPSATVAQTALNYRTNLLLYKNRNGEIETVDNTRDWKKRRAEILVGMQEVMGPLPGKEKRCPLAINVEEEVDCGTYIRRTISYASEPNSRVPAFLLIPRKALEKKQKVPAVLALHPTEQKIGYKVVIGLGKENRAYGNELAERGYVVLAPNYPLMAGYQPDVKTLGYESGTMKAIWDNIRGVDLLESLPYVRKGRIGAIGHSLGGHNSIYTAVFDERIKVVISSCGFDSYVDYMNGNITGWTQDRYMPRLASYAKSLNQIPFDFYEMIAALAPRNVFVNAPLRDHNFKYQSVDAITASARPVFALYNAEQKIHVEHPDCAHDFPPEIRELAYKTLDENLK